ncbi:MAG: hypothetical protein AAF634_08195 [Bacteroidota bacterium]
MKISTVFGIILVLLNLVLLGILFKGPGKIQKFEEIEVQRINLVEPDGTLKLAFFNSKKLGRGLDGDKRQGTGTISGMFFYNEEGYETGGLVFDGKKIVGGQKSGIGLMFDGYRQDQTIALQHNEQKDSSTSYYEDGLRIMSRPDRSDVSEEYDFYKLKYPDVFGDENTPRLAKEVLDSMDLELARQYKVAKQRIYLGSVRGNKGDGWFDNSGLYIKNKYGKDMIKIYVDKDNHPKIEILDTLGQVVKYNLIPEYE